MKRTLALLTVALSLPLVACEPVVEDPSGVVPTDGTWGFEVLHPTVSGDCGGLDVVDLHGQVLSGQLSNLSATRVVVNLEGLTLDGVRDGDWLALSGDLSGHDGDQEPMPGKEVPDWDEGDGDGDGDGDDDDDDHGDDDRSDEDCGVVSDTDVDEKCEVEPESELGTTVALDAWLPSAERMEGTLTVQTVTPQGTCTVDAEIDGWHAGEEPIWTHDRPVEVGEPQEGTDLPASGSA